MTVCEEASSFREKKLTEIIRDLLESRKEILDVEEHEQDVLRNVTDAF